MRPWAGLRGMSVGRAGTGCGTGVEWREHQGEEKWINWIEESTRNTGTWTNISVIGLSYLSDF